MITDFPEPLQDFILKKVAIGEFASVDELLVAAVEFYKDMDDRRTRLKEKIAAATAELERGEFIDLNGEDELHAFFEGIKREGRKRLLQSRTGDNDY